MRFPRYATFASMDGQPVRHAFVERIPEVDTSGSRAEMLARLWPYHLAVVGDLGFGRDDLVLAEQIHGGSVAVVEPSSLTPVYPRADALIAGAAGLVLGIHVADCCAVFIVDPVRRAIGLVHSGREGTRLGVVPAAIEALRSHFGSRGADLVIQLSPCIRPPDFEVDFAAEIRRQCAACGVTEIHDDGTSTADLTRYYSHRMERGRTGRMLALLGLPRPSPP